MRKLLSVLALGGMLALTSCDDSTTASPSATATSTSLIGTWFLSETFSEGGVNYSVDFTATFAAPNSLTTNQKVKMAGNLVQDTTTKATWSTSGSTLFITSDGETDTTTYAVSGSKLTIISEDTMVFTRK